MKFGYLGWAVLAGLALMGNKNVREKVAYGFACAADFVKEDSNWEWLKHEESRSNS